MKKISLNDIKSGVLVGKPQKVSVQIPLQGEDVEFETYIKPFSYDTTVAQMKAFSENKEALAGILASCICDEEGVLVFQEAEIRTQFNQELVDALWAKIYEMNMLGKKSNSQPKTKSSVKSQSHSEKQSAKSGNSRKSKSDNGKPTEENEAALTSDEESSKPLAT
ncbi:phage tail assembly chaperone family protein, TAC [Acinetobacter puyangensis]|uniref:phage tail assembly chaperone family protein, TAC n=1 Tax=Acinetobacter puyangensis TaxID=1096779 RepID=UPI003A4DA0BF